ncbi:MAG: hypothetical protein HYR94_18605 [Chloroflexi bacterium]|nr:hypothetical protein [Chloroflexota bacterium]
MTLANDKPNGNHPVDSSNVRETVILGSGPAGLTAYRHRRFAAQAGCTGRAGICRTWG